MQCLSIHINFLKVMKRKCSRIWQAKGEFYKAEKDAEGEYHKVKKGVERAYKGVTKDLNKDLTKATSGMGSKKGMSATESFAPFN